MPTEATPTPRVPFTIPLADGPVAAWLDRALAGAAFAAAAAAAILLVGVEPDAKGYDTHVRFGMDPCGWPLAYGIPCPTCGCTTAACLLVHGRVVAAFVAQPFGATLAAAGLLLGAHGLSCLLRGRSFADLLVRLPFWRVVAGAFVLLLASWYYKYLVFAP
jgi:hypothetical protein